MKIYLVGGAVRNKILNLPVIEKDWVVIGSSINKMLKLGFKKVGKKFPVFIHPQTKEEYALARKEFKNGYGHKNFIFDFSPKITLIEDLYRRDITINSIAEDKNGNIIDPFNGIKDIENKVIRHTSISFVEDPLRVLRICRLYSVLGYLNFKIDINTLKLMIKISSSGELKYISYERVWKETYKALNSKNPELYFYILYKTQSLFNIFSEFLYFFKNTKIFLKIFFKIINKIKKLPFNPYIKFSYIIYEMYKKSNIKNIKKNISNLILIFFNKLGIKKQIRNILINIINNIEYIKKINFINYNEIINLFYKIKINNINNFNNFIKICFFDIKKNKFLKFEEKIYIIDYFYIVNNIINTINIKYIKYTNKNNIKNEIIKKQKLKLLKLIKNL